MKRPDATESEVEEYEIVRPRFEETYHSSNPCDPVNETRNNFESSGKHNYRGSKIMKSLIEYAKDIDDCFYQPDRRYISKKRMQNEMRLD